jgi:hypothetical protein
MSYPTALAGLRQALIPALVHGQVVPGELFGSVFR